MIIVGSRCGGYNFYAETNEKRIWLGSEQDSDLDIFSDAKPTSRDLKIDWIGTEQWFLKRLANGNLNIWNGVARPWLYKNTLHIPSNFDFLNIAIRKKLRKQGANWRNFIGKKFYIYSPLSEKRVAEIKFRFVF